VATYKEAGVDIETGDALVERIKPFAKATQGPEVLSGVGGFGGLFAFPSQKYRQPVLVSGTDGVGTKLKVAFMANRHDTVGIDLVAMCANDVLTSGAEPLFFLDYFATSALNVDQASQVVSGIARGCEEAGCALIGGETAELPGFYAKGEYDLAGFCVGVVDRERIVDGSRIKPGDALVGLASSGLHSNGYSLARKICFVDNEIPLFSRPPGCPRVLADELLEPTRIYVRDVFDLAQAVDIKGMAHITGSGIPGNVPRCLPQGTRAQLYESGWKQPPIFEFLAARGRVTKDEMYATFNMGLGFVIVLPNPDVPAALRALKARKVTAWEIGQIERGEGDPKVVFSP
jgi:phosphoribosylformylglycinamidine cyclo-ligase